MNHRATDRIIEIVELISLEKDGLKLSEIVSLTKIPKTTVYHILNALKVKEIIEETGKEVKRYRLGIGAFIIANRYSRNLDIVNIGRPMLEALSNQLGMTSFIAQNAGIQMIYIYKYEPNNTLITTANIGSNNTLYSSALGKAYLSTLNENHLNKVVSQLKFVSKTENTIKDKNTLIKDSFQTKKKGFAVDDRESESHILCVASPVYNHLNQYVASISVSCLYREEIDHDQLGQHTKKVAEEMSYKLGFVGEET